MAVILPLLRTPHRYPSLRPAQWPFAVNRGSAQARGLLLWVPVVGTIPVALDMVDGLRGSTLLAPLGVPDPGVQAANFTNNAVQRSPIVGSGTITPPTVSWSVWARPLAANTDIMVGKRSGAAFHHLAMVSTGIVRVTVPVPASTDLDGTSSIRDGKAHLVGASYNGARLRIIVDGKEYAAMDLTGAISYTGEYWTLGGWHNTSSNPFTGQLWDFRVYNRYLTNDDWRQMYEPATRWDLYYELGRRQYYFPAAQAAGTFAAIIPDAILASTNLTGAVTDIDDDPDSPGVDWITATVPTSGIDLRVSFADLPGGGGTLTGAQNFKLWLRKTAGAPDPTVDVELWENGVFVATLLNDVAITSTSGQLLTASWNASQVAADNDGSLIECRVVGGPA